MAKKRARKNEWLPLNLEEKLVLSRKLLSLFEVNNSPCKPSI